MQTRQLVYAITAAVGIAFAIPAHAETLTDRCSAEVAFVPSFNAKPNAHLTQMLKRNSEGKAGWTAPFKVQTDSDGYIRWWCHSTTGNFLDPGTWEVHVNAAGIVACASSVVGTVASDGAAAPALATCEKAVTLGSSAFKGWTPERSRCSDHSNRIRVRLGPDRLLETECLGK
ncbi:MAG TPA: hypothetical protein VHW09_11205 [Bryobacteraceae bacterium]|jgi:hypothetical protein|nr:hypothetical protein [Bryobacteraceae bacterium]